MLCNVAIRADASLQLGLGHVMRCLTLADKLKPMGALVLFICGNLDGHVASMIRQRGYFVGLLPRRRSGGFSSLDFSWKRDAEGTISVVNSLQLDWMIVDHYEIDERWHKALRPYAKKIMVIDDLADRKLDCDLLLDQTYARDAKDYFHLTPRHSKLLVGAEYALLRSEFFKLRFGGASIFERRKVNSLRHILVAMGGVDQDNLTSKIINILDGVEWVLAPTVDIVISSVSPNLAAIKQSVEKSQLKINIIVDAENIAELMVRADFSIGAGGTTSWERCCLGLPSALITMAENQKEVINALVTINAAISVGISQQIDEGRLANFLSSNLKKSNKIMDMSAAAFNVCDGLGDMRVAQYIIPNGGKRDVYMRAASLKDALIMFELQSTLGIRKYSRNPSAPSWDEHIIWFEKKINDPECIFSVLLVETQVAGIVRLDKLSAHGEYEISILIAPDMQGKGVALQGLEITHEMLVSFKIYAEIHPNNYASLKLFKKAGYTKIGKNEYVFQQG